MVKLIEDGTISLRWLKGLQGILDGEEPNAYAKEHGLVQHRSCATTANR